MQRDDDIQVKNTFLDKEDIPKYHRLTSVSENAKYIYIALIIGILFSLIISGLGISIIRVTKSNNPLAIMLIVFGLLSCLAFGFGIFATKWYVDRIDKTIFDNKDPEDVDQSSERQLLNVFLYLMMILFLIFLIISITCFTSQSGIKYQIKSIAQNKEKWNKYFGNMTYDYVMSKANLVLYFVAGISLFLSLFILALLIFAFKMLGTYRSWQTVVQFVCVLFFKLGFVLLYFAIFAEKYRDVAKVDKAMPSWISGALLGFSVISILIAILGFVATYMENKQLLRIFILVIGIFTAAVLVVSIGGALNAGRFNEYFQKRCYKIMDYVRDDWLVKYAGCEKKYLFVSNNIDNLKCPKERIATAWEANLGIEADQQKDAYGCLDQSCCYSTYSTIKDKIDIVAVIAFALFGLGCVMIGGGIYVLTKLERGEEHGAGSKQTKYFLYILSVIVILIMVVFIALIPSPPTPSPLSVQEVDKAPANNSNARIESVIQANVTQVTKNTEENNSKEAIKATNITENKSGCEPNCLKLKYYYELSSDDGIFAPDMIMLNSAKIDVTTNKAQGTGWIVGFNGDETNLNNFMKYYKFVQNCPLFPASINVKVQATAYKPAPTAFIQTKSKNRMKQDNSAVTNTNSTTTDNTNSTNTNNSQSIDNASVYDNSTVIDVAKMKEGETLNIIQKTLDYSFVSKDYVLMSGKVVQVIDLNTTNPINNALVTLTPIEFTQCKTRSIKTDANGDFKSDKFYILYGDIPLTYRVDVTSPDLASSQRIIKVGGVGWTRNKNLGLISLWAPGMLDKTTISTTVLNSMTNLPLDGANVTIYTGYKNFENSQHEESHTQSEIGTASSFLQLTLGVTTQANNITDKDTNIYGREVTNGNGTFKFTKLDPNTYTLVFEKDDYYREVYCNIFY